MENTEEIEVAVTATTLESEVKEFANGLPYWAKYLCSQILSGNEITEEIIATSYSYLLQDLNLAEATEKPDISITFNPNASGDYKEKIVFDGLKSVQGVNALAENQPIEFCPNLTILYGANGSGKSGYVRLLKNAFYSKDKEDILENVNLESGHKPVYAEFSFSSEGNPITLKYPEDANNGIFNQFAVFDGEVGKKHLNNRNDFSFRPGGLTLFSEFNGALEKLQAKLSSEIQLRQIHNPFAEDDIFQGESEIKTFLTNLSHKSNLEELKKHLPFTEDDRRQKAEKEKAYDDLKIALSQKDKSIKALKSIKVQLAERKKHLEIINQYFNQEYLNSVRTSISDCKTKQETAKKEGVSKFKTEKIKKVGSPEWKQFIEAAEKFALIQKDEGQVYPEIGDNCLLCQQPIKDEATKKLIASYWEYIKSVAEQEAKTALEGLENIKKKFEVLDLNRFPETDTLTAWLNENHNETLETIKQTASNQATLRTDIVSDISGKTASERTAVQVDMKLIDNVDTDVDKKIKALEEDEQTKALAKLLAEKTYLAHKEKLSQRISDIEKLHANMVWVNKANKFSKQSWKKHSTDTAKRLSGKYFNEEYIEKFNNECTALNGNFGIEIDTKGSDGQSNRQLFLKGWTPSAILSEGEQKVIALADFIAETSLSTINKGVVFDDPVNSLDHDRKKIFAERFVELSCDKQVIVFTHDVVFFKYLENYAVKKYGKNTDELQFHTVKSNGKNSIGNIVLNHSPVRESIYGTPHIPNKYLSDAKAKESTDPDYSLNLVRSGFGALRTCYEAITVTKLLGSTVQRYDTLVRVANIKKVKYNLPLYDKIAERHSFLHDLIEGHLPVEELNISFTCEKLEEEIKEFDNILTEIDKI